MKNLPEQLSTYSTPDLGIAVFLFTLGHELIKTTVVGQRRLVFHFQCQDKTDTLVAKFLNGTGEASAKKLFENYRSLRAIAFSQTNNLR
jgi:hypothetical protein